MAKLIPAKIDGPHVTFGAFLDDGSFVTETWTHTDEDGKPQPAKDVQGYCAEFALLVADREKAAAPVSAEEYATGGKYVDPETGEAMTAKDAKELFADATPVEAEAAQ